jgi:non-canonical purine NTP pyrophosphatase (RdgB/HAM1 family)
LILAELRKVVLASRNADKVRELKELFKGMPFDVVAASDYPGLPEVIEDGTTILGNATRKAVITAAYTGEIALADDTSLQVRELNSWPDVFASRFSGEGATYESNSALTLKLMDGVDDKFRQARFATACVWVDPRPEVVAHDVSAPAERRWLRNPWERAIEIKDLAGEWDFWNKLRNRREVWHQYGAAMLSDLVGHGHDHEGLQEAAREILASCPDFNIKASKEAGMRLPDSRIWAVEGPETATAAPTQVAPSGLDPEAPGRGVNEAFWFELSTEGRLLGKITEQPMGGRGFGYDPIFRPIGHRQTLAELDAQAKNKISHRGRALRRMITAVRSAYGLG